MSKMFKTVTKTWNVFTGCGFNCYNGGCWAKNLVLGRLATQQKYADGFKPTFHPQELKKKFKPGDFVFVSSMGDISFCENLYPEIIGNIEDNPKTNFLLQTKNPAMFIANDFPPNVYTGATIETNRDITVSKAPHPRQRALDMIMNQHPYKFLSIEPIMDFDLIEFSKWIYDINPEIVEIGADNYHNNLPEPEWEKVYKLIDILTLHGVKVVQKEGLERLKE